MEATRPKIFTSHAGLHKEFADSPFVDVELIYTFYQQFFVDGKGLQEKLNVDKLKALLDAAGEGRKVVPDWEGETWKQAFKMTRGAQLPLMDALVVAREHRPDCQFSLYASGQCSASLPPSSYWDSASPEQIEAEAQRWLRRWGGIARLCDFLAPSCYDFMQGPSAPEAARTRGQIAIAKRHCPTTPLYPYTWHRRSIERDGKKITEIIRTNEWMLDQIIPAFAGGADAVILWSDHADDKADPNLHRTLAERVRAIVAHVSRRTQLKPDT